MRLESPKIDKTTQWNLAHVKSGIWSWVNIFLIKNIGLTVGYFEKR